MTQLTLFCGTVTRLIDSPRALPVSCPQEFAAPVEVSTDADGLHGSVLCCTAQPLAVGQAVVGAACCRRDDGMPLGICLPDACRVFVERYPIIASAFLEYEASRFAAFLYSGEGLSDGRAFWPQFTLNSTDTDIPILGMQHTLFAAEATANAVRIPQTRANGNTRYRTNLRCAEDDFSFDGEVDLPVRTEQTLLFLNHIGRNDARPHPFALAPIFSDWLRSLDADAYAAMANLLASPSFPQIGQLLRYRRKRVNSLIEEGASIRVLSIAPRDTLVRTLGIGHADAFHRTEFSCEHDFSAPPGTLCTATFGKIGDRITLDNVLPMKTEFFPAPPQPAEAEQTPAADAAEPPEAETETTFKDTQELLIIRENEKCFRLEKNSGKFNSSSFYRDIQNHKVGSLHYDILEWISYFKYVTGQLVFRMMMSEFLPQFAQELTEGDRESISRIRRAAKIASRTLVEGEHTQTIHFTIRQGDRLNRLLDKLCAHNLIQRARFGATQDCGERKYSVARFYIQTQYGSNLLHTMERRSRAFDPFSYMREPAVVKELLAGNQLMVAFWEELHKRFTIHRDEIQIENVISTPTVGEGLQKNTARLSFCMPLHHRDRPEQTLLLYGESIRNTAGLSAGLEETDILEKIPRLLYIANHIARTGSTPIVLSYVFTTYDEMCTRAATIEQTARTLADRSPNLHLLYTYDTTILGPPDNRFFTYDPAANRPTPIDAIATHFADLFR